MALAMACLMLVVTTDCRAKSTKVRSQTTVEHSSGPSYKNDARINSLADEIATTHHIDKAWVKSQLALAKKNRKVIQFVSPPKAGFVKNWAVYKGRFIDEVRIRSGVKFWNTNEAWLNKAQQQYGVPAWLVVGIVGVETIFGQDTGRFLSLDALTTLALDFPAAHPKAAQRQAYFRQELGHLMAMAHNREINPRTLRTSYAGAMGWPQFMPSSWQRFAVDFDADGKRDLFTSEADVIGSVANYFVQHGWVKDMPTHFHIQFDDALVLENRQYVLAPDIVPTFAAMELEQRQVKLEADGRTFAGKLSVVELHNGENAPTYFAGTQNFFVITRYNWSAYYAMAVIELGHAISQARKSNAGEQPANSSQ
ncbi:MAG: hypothetical protein RLZZ271_66 [Pseudomonadota bacterium]|jgi:membrane-bound lytic murein transglycosylase B